MTTTYLADVLEEIGDEADRARQKFGEQSDLSDPQWLAVLAEEFGEAAMAVTKRDVPPYGKAPTLAELHAEVVQVGAVAARWARAIQRRAVAEASSEADVDAVLRAFGHNRPPVATEA